MNATAVRRLVVLDAHVPLAAAAVVIVAVAATGVDAPTLAPLTDAVVATTGLALVWDRRDELRLPVLLALAAALALARVGISLAHDVHGDLDPRSVYDIQGRALLHGTYPGSPYPVGAVALFALEALLGGSAHNVNGLLMVPFHLLCVGALWRLGTRWSGWFAACVAIWPANAFFWQFRFDLVAAASIVTGIALARRDRWVAAGLVLGAGAAVKWTPGLTALALAAWLVARRRPRDAARHAVAAVLPLSLATLPVLAVAFDAAAAPYRAQSVRGITGESLPYLPLRLAGLASPARHYYGAATTPGWASAAAATAQLALVAAVVVLAARAPTARIALARAGVAPAVFLLTNRIFSPQFLVVVLACCACAAALVLSRAREVAVVSAALGAATLANAVLFPGLVGAAAATWTSVSALALVPAAGVTAYLAVRRPS